MSERDTLLKYRQWNVDMLSNVTDSYSEAYLNRYVDDLDYRLETDPPRPMPLCGWTKSIREHPYPCPKKGSYCNEAYDAWNIAQSNKAVSQSDEDTN